MEKISLREKNDKSIETYEKNVSKLPRKFNSLFESVLGKGIKKEDIIRLDAEMENELIDRVEELKKKNDTEGLSKAKEELDKFRNSNLIIDVKVKMGGLGGMGYSVTRKIEGTIKGEEASIKELQFNSGEVTKSRFEYKGTVNGKEVNEPENMYKEYSPIAIKRTERIESFLKDIRNKKVEQEKEIKDDILNKM